MENGDVLWDGCTDGEGDLLEFVQYEAAKIVMGAMKGTTLCAKIICKLIFSL